MLSSGILQSHGQHDADFDISEFKLASHCKHKKRCIFSFALGSHFLELKELTVPGQLDYAKKCKADYYCFTKPGVGMPGSSGEKHQQHSCITYNKI